MTIRDAHEEASSRAFKEVGDAERSDFCSAYRRAMQDLVVAEMTRHGAGIESVRDFMRNEKCCWQCYLKRIS